MKATSLSQQHLCKLRLFHPRAAIEHARLGAVRSSTWEMASGAESSRDELIAQLRARVTDLERQLGNGGSKRERIDTMSAEVVDTNPYRSVGFFSAPVSLLCWFFSAVD